MPDPQSLPVLPAAHARALAALRDEDVANTEVAAIVETDPALTAAVLRAANSAASAPINRIATAQQGVARIGLQRTRQLVTGAVMSSSFQGLTRAGLDLDELWRHLIACALLNDRVAAQGDDRSSAFTAGLMHDLGRMAMANADPERYSWVVKLARQGRPAIEAETELFGHDHQELGLRVAEEWQLPEPIVEAAAGHHDSGDGAGAGGVAALTRYSRELARTIGFGDGVLPAEPTPGSLEDLVGSDKMLLSALGAAEGLRTQVEWFRDSVAAA